MLSHVILDQAHSMDPRESRSVIYYISSDSNEHNSHSPSSDSQEEDVIQRPDKKHLVLIDEAG